MQQLADPGEELGVQRLIEAERGADALELLRRCVFAGQRCGGISGRQPQQQKHEQRHHAHYRDGDEDAAKQISEHLDPTQCDNRRRRSSRTHIPAAAYQVSKSRANAAKVGTHASVANSPAISRPRSARLSTSMCSLSVCASAPRTPRPSNVGTPIAPVKLPSEPPPALPWGNSRPISRAIPRALSYSAMVPASGSQTGRVTPRGTLQDTSLALPDSASMRSTPRSRSAWRLAMLSASPVQVVATQLTHWPPCTMPTEKVQSSVVMASMAMIWRAISRIAERPEESVAPAWLGLPVSSRLRRAIAYRPVTTPWLARPGSGTSTYLLRLASASMMSRVEGVPTSSSGVNNTVIGSGVVNAARANCRIASSVR